MHNFFKGTKVNKNYPMAGISMISKFAMNSVQTRNADHGNYLIKIENSTHTFVCDVSVKYLLYIFLHIQHGGKDKREN